MSQKLVVLISAIWLFLFTLDATAQSTVKGKVIDENGEEIPGVSIIIKGTSKGTVSDLDGNFTISAEPGDVIQFSYIGYKTQQITLGSQSSLEVELQEDVTTLAGVEIIEQGYGQVDRKLLSTSVSTVDAKEIEQMPVASFDQALQGRAAGVQVTKATGAPGGAVSIRIRGTASLNSGQEPLYVVDGVPISNTFTGSNAPPGAQASQGQAGNEVLNGLAGIPAEDIESFTILKDAAAASIYGARAANGVILITTKRGKEGKPQVSFKTEGGIQRVTRKYQLLDANQYAAAANEGLLRTGAPIFFTETPEYNTDWQDEIFRLASSVNSNLSVRGGNESTRYSFSLGYLQNNGIIINTGFDRYSFRANLDHEFGKKLKIGSNFSFARTVNNRLRNTGGANVQDAFNNNNLFGPSVISTALVAPPIYPARDENGQFVADSLTLYGNPVALANGSSLLNKNYLVIGNLFLNYTIFEGFTFYSSFGYNIRDENLDFFFPQVPGAPGGGRIQQGSYNEVIWTTTNYLTYKKSFMEKHFLEVLLGSEIQQNQNRGFQVQGSGVQSDVVRSLGAAQEFSNPYSTGFNDWAIASFFTRLKYDYDEKYIFNATFRTDGSSRFGPERKFGFFPSASFAWQVGDEAFMDGVSFVEDLKFRSSYGVTGNDQINPFGWRASVEPINSQNYLSIRGAEATSIQVEDYSWETTTQLNLGLDMSLLSSNRINLTVDYYDKQTTGLLLFQPLPRTTGFSSALKNVGSMQNRGWELGINGEIMRSGKLTWSASFNVSQNFNKILSTVNGEDIVSGAFGYGSVARIGEEISFQLFQLQDNVNPVSGNRNIKDLNGNGIRDQGDLQIVGSPLPDFFGGFNNNVSIGDLNFTMFFTYSYGNMIINSTRGFIQSTGKPDLNRVGPNMGAESLTRWQQEGDVTSFPKMNYANNFEQTQEDQLLSAAGVPTDQNLEDGSFLRFKTLNVSYNLPARWFEGKDLSRGRVYFSTNNIFTLTRYSGYDPEVNHNAGANGVGSNVAIGYDNGTYPQSITVVLGVSFNW